MGRSQCSGVLFWLPLPLRADDPTLFLECGRRALVPRSPCGRGVRGEGAPTPGSGGISRASGYPSPPAWADENLRVPLIGGLRGSVAQFGCQYLAPSPLVGEGWGGGYAGPVTSRRRGARALEGVREAMANALIVTPHPGPPPQGGREPDRLRPTIRLRRRAISRPHLAVASGCGYQPSEPWVKLILRPISHPRRPLRSLTANRAQVRGEVGVGWPPANAVDE
jgi:hypothetical protein